MKRMYLISLSALILCMGVSLGAQASGSIISKGEEASTTISTSQDQALLRAELARVRRAENSADIDKIDEIIDRLQEEGETVDGGTGNPRLGLGLEEEGRLRAVIAEEDARVRDPQSE